MQEVVRRRLAPLGDAVGDPLGNVGSRSGPADGPLVAVAAHADQIGLIVTHVDEHGYVSVERIGGVAPLLVPGRHFVIHGRGGGRARGRRAQAHAHHPRGGPRQGAAAPRAVPRHRRQRSREEALERVAVGDPVTFTPDFIELSPGVVATQALDDRAGVYAVIRALELYAEAPGGARLTGLSPPCTKRPRSWAPRRSALRLRPGRGHRARRRLLQRHAGGGRQGAGRRGQARRRPRPRPRRRQQRAPVALAREVAAAEGLAVQIKAYPGETEHRRRRAHGRRRGGHPHRRPADALHALALRGRPHRRPRGRGAPCRRPGAAPGGPSATPEAGPR